MAELPKLLTLKQWELQKKYESIQSELNTWETLTEKGQPLEKHYRQVRRLNRALAGMIEAVQDEIGKLQKSTDLPTFLSQVRRVEFLILEVHRTWHYFRQKLTARQGQPFGKLLEALDEFVWECYSPAFANKDAPEPPLTFSSSDWSPAASPRHELLPLEHTVDLGTGLFAQSGKLGEKRLRMLVIPVINMPWFQTTFLPETLLLAHETAHLIDYDLKLADNIRRNLRAAEIENHRLEAYWIPWSTEVFADAFAVLHLGPAYVGTLSLLLSRSQEEVLHTPVPNKLYPPHHLRMLIALHTLKNIASGAFVGDAAGLEKTWNETYGNPVPGRPERYEITDYLLSECAADIEKVVGALLDGKFDALGGKSLKEVKDIPWTMQEQRKAVAVRDSLLAVGERLPGVRPRVLLAGVQLAFQERPQALASSGSSGQKTQTDLIKKIVASRVSGIRGPSDPRPLPELNQNSDEADRAKGRQLAQALLAEFEGEQQSKNGAEQAQ